MTTIENEQPLVGPMDRPGVREFMGEKANFYLTAFEKISAKKTSWNWPAFLLGIAWMCYRGMYRYAAIVAGTICVVTALEMAFGLPAVLGQGFSMAVWVAFGLLGNWCYQRHVEREIAELDAKGLSDEELLSMAAEKGKPSVLMGFVGFFVFFAILWVLMMAIPVPG